METPGGRKIGLLILVFLLTELSDLMVNRLKKLNHVVLVKYIYIYFYIYIQTECISIYTQNVKMEPFCHSVGLRSLNIICHNSK